MKTKNKMIALVEIAIVLCSVFLVATLPAIAADQTTQKVSATTTSEDEPLGIYGNANEDDTIDMRDVTYIKLIIFGKRDETQLADACYDGEIDVGDIIQTKLIILGREGKLTVEDDYGEAVTYSLPMERFVCHIGSTYPYETLRALNVEDRVVGITDRFLTPGSWLYSENYFPEHIGMTNVGMWKSLDYEVINELKPDAVITDSKGYLDTEKMPGIPVITMSYNLEQFTGHTRKCGYIFDRREEAEEYINWYKGWENILSERTEELSEDEKLLVFLTWWWFPSGVKTFAVYGKDNRRSMLVRMAGGNNLGDEISGSGSVKVDPEWLIERNPEVIVFAVANQYLGYDAEDASDAKALRDDFLSRTEWAKVDAVKNKRVYLVSGVNLIEGGANGLVGCLYWAKLFYPDLFKDIDPQEVHQEFVTKYQHVDINVREDCKSIYPPQ